MKSKYKKAIEAIEAAATVSGKTINVRYQNSRKTVNRYKAKWVITVYGKNFYDKDFIIAVREALIYWKRIIKTKL